MRALNAKMGGDALPQIVVDGDDACLAVHGQKAVALGKRFKFFFDFGLIQDEGLKQIVGKGKVAARTPNS